MTASDQLKLIEAGFSIIRDRNFDIPKEAGPFQIFIKDHYNHEWHNYSRHNTKADRIRLKTDLLKTDKVVED